jgi:hypothetical protein
LPEEEDQESETTIPTADHSPLLNKGGQVQGTTSETPPAFVITEEHPPLSKKKLPVKEATSKVVAKHQTLAHTAKRGAAQNGHY